MHHQEPLPLGRIDHRAYRGRLFGIRPADLARHLYVLGRSGSGKTTLLEHLIRAELARGHGLAVLDPHGDLVERLLDLVPRARTNEVVLLDPWDAERTLALNPLEAQPGVPTHLVASGVLSAFRKAFAGSWGPRLEHIYRNALLAAMGERGGTLLTVLRLLDDDSFRRRVIPRVRDPLVRLFWEREFAAWSPNFLAEALAPVQNKLGAALGIAPLRRLLGQYRSSIRLRELMDRGGIFLANLSKGALGEDGSTLLGALLTTGFELAAWSRADLAPHARRPFTVYVDEFASFVTPSFVGMLAEARKYGLRLVLAHQHLGQLDEALRRAILGNVGTLLTFAVGGEDAEALEREFGPELSAEDLTRLDAYQFAIRLSVDGTTTRPFTAMALPPTGDAERVGVGAGVRRVSRDRHARDARTTDSNIHRVLER